jgi:hypothetical protein
VSQKNAKLSRRNFLLSAGAGGIATAAAVVAGRTSGQSAATDGKRKARGYHETAHTSNYYRTAKV